MGLALLFFAGFEAHGDSARKFIDYDLSLSVMVSVQQADKFFHFAGKGDDMYFLELVPELLGQHADVCHGGKLEGDDGRFLTEIGKQLHDVRAAVFEKEDLSSAAIASGRVRINYVAFGDAGGACYLLIAYLYRIAAQSCHIASCRCC